MLSKNDIIEILGVAERDIRLIPFKNWNGVEVIDERELQKLWYKSAIPNSPPAKIRNATVSLDELILIKLIREGLHNPRQNAD